MKTRQELLDICKMVSEDVESDAKGLDGKPFNGKTVAEQFGNNCAAIKALACVLQEVLQQLPP